MILNKKMRFAAHNKQTEFIVFYAPPSSPSEPSVLARGNQRRHAATRRPGNHDKIKKQIDEYMMGKKYQ